uniref:Uncharacterized protein n=1 Tax=Bionectria ochroleuca TaxID=29856 RepID=A0A0B7K494_BIOOC
MLRESLDTPDSEFVCQVATFLTILMIESYGVYSTEVYSWRSHFIGAATLVSKMLHSRDWAESSDAWVISQSLALSLEIAQTGYIDSVHHAGPAGMLLDVLFTRSDFGYTIGSPGAALKALSTLQRVDGTDERLHYLAQLHSQMFLNAVIIYLKRLRPGVTPSKVSTYTSSALNDMSTFLDLNGGSISLWSVFVAVVEACTPTERDMVRRWFEFSSRLGIENRVQARQIIETVWQTRDSVMRWNAQ